MTEKIIAEHDHTKKAQWFSLDVGTGKSEMASTLASTSFTWPCTTICPTHVKFACQNSTFAKCIVRFV